MEEAALGAASPDETPAGRSRSRRLVLRTFCMAVYAGVLLFWSHVVGFPRDPVQLVFWVWLATIAWHVEDGRRATARFARDWALPFGVLLFYTYSKGLAAHAGMPLQWRAPIRVEEWLGHGRTGAEILQSSWCGHPCASHAGAHWYDTVFTIVYFSHFVVAPTLAGVLYVGRSPHWGGWMRRYLAVSILGVTGYVVFPMAPPWMASDHGLLAQPIQRLTGRGGFWLGLHVSDLMLGQQGNITGAMPSLHAATAMLVALWGIERFRSALRWGLLAYPLVMGVMLVYFGEHYVIDIVVGYALAIVVVLGCRRWERRRERRREQRRADLAEPVPAA